VRHGINGMKTEVDLDIRYFRRYPKQAEFLLSCKTGVHKAKMVDYSLTGLGIIIDDLEAPVSKGDLISFDIDEPDLYAMGKVAWTAETPFGLRVGVVKTEPFKGRLNRYPLSDILVSLHRTRKTGVLQIRRGTVDKKVFIRKGDIIFAASNYDKDRFGDVLLKNRKINRKQYDRAAEMKRKSGVSYITILLHMGYLNSADIMGARQLQARRIISSLFLMKDSEFQFIEGILPREDDMIVSLPIADILYRETKKKADLWLLENYLLDRVVDISPNPLNLFQNLRIAAADKSILGNVNGKRSIRTIVQLSGSYYAVNTLKVIYALLETRFLKIADPGGPPRGLRNTLAKKERDPFIDHIEQLYSEFKKIDYYRILDVQPNDPVKEIKKAFFNAELKYHPDMYPLIDEDIEKKLIEIFAYIKTAYLTLSDPVKRREYDLGMEESKERKDLLPDTGLRVSPVQDDVQQNKSEAVPQAPGTIITDNSNKAKRRFRDGKVAFWDKNYNKAARLFEMAKEFDDSVPEYHYMYGRALGNLGRNKEAMQALNRANELKPLDPDTLAELGHLYLKLGFPSRAESYFKQVIKIDPSNKRSREGITMRGSGRPR
jgi:tetratricopeptide (TPR) repeat protein